MENYILRAMLTRRLHDMIRKSIKIDIFSTETRNIIKDISKFYASFPNNTSVNHDEFLGWLKNFRRPLLSDSDYTFYKTVIENLPELIDDSAIYNLIKSAKELEFATVLNHDIQRYQLGEEVDIYTTARDHLKAYSKFLQPDSGIDQTVTIDDVFNEASLTTAGYQFRQQSLSDSLYGSLTKGIFGIVAARPDSGKTSFVADLATHVAGQITSGRPILWFNNEGHRTRILNACIRGALGISTKQMIDAGKDRIQEAYIKALGSTDAIKIIDCHGKSIDYLERCIEVVNPEMVIYDMLDNVRGFEHASASGTVDARYEMLYQHAREMSVIYGHIAIATSQISVEGSDKQWVQMSALKGAKTSKQGACDWILMIGQVDNPSKLASRFMYTPKNKMQQRNGARKDTLVEMIFDWERARFKDIPSTIKVG